MHPEGLSIPERREILPLKIYDAPYTYRGYYDQEPKGLAHVRLFSHPFEHPVIVITDLPENATTSVTNLMETLVPEIIRDLGKAVWFEEEKPPIVIEHLPPMAPEEQMQAYGRQSHRKDDQYAQASFETWRPRTIWIGGQERLSLGEPTWKHLKREEVIRLIGEEEVEKGASASR